MLNAPVTTGSSIVADALIPPRIALQGSEYLGRLLAGVNPGLGWGVYLGRWSPKQDHDD